MIKNAERFLLFGIMFLFVKKNDKKRIFVKPKSYLSAVFSALFSSVIRNYNATQYTDDFVQLLSQYAKSHCKIEDDRKIMWIDEVIHPFKQEWTSVTYLKEHDYPAPMGPKDRGKDYNHSTFCDLVISGICGVEVTDDDVKINPIIPDDWEYFNLSDLCIKDKVYSISYNKVTGLKVNKKQRR